jgi:hypothetical protein
MKTALLVAGIISAFVIVILGVGLSSDHFEKRRIDRDLHANLAVGDLPAKIESALVEEKLEFSFDRRQNRYQAIYRPKSIPLIPRGDVCVYVYVDEAKRLTKIEDVMTYTFL